MTPIGTSGLEAIDDPSHPVLEVLKGAVDTHLHAMPFINESVMEYDVFQVSQEAARAQMRAVVIKPYFGSSCQVAYLANKYANGAQVVGGITLNFAAGGFNADAVRVAAHDGVYSGFRPGRVAWMPERSALHRARHLGFDAATQEKYLSPFRGGDVDKGLTTQAAEVLEVIGQEDMVLATSHLSPEEGLGLVELGKAFGITRYLLTHATHDGVGYTFEQKKQAASMGAFIEESTITWEPAMSLFHYRPVDANSEIFDAIIEIGPEHFCLGTDAGFWAMPSPLEAMKVFVALLMGRGLSVEQLRKMTVDNPVKLLRLDEPDQRPEATRDSLGN